MFTTFKGYRFDTSLLKYDKKVKLFVTCLALSKNDNRPEIHTHNQYVTALYSYLYMYIYLYKVAYVHRRILVNKLHAYILYSRDDYTLNK